VGRSIVLAVTDSSGSALPDAEVEWSSAHVTIATVTAEGEVTGVGPGVTTITAAADGTSASAEITVERASPLRSYVDEPDEVTGSQIHFIYAVPKDGTDRGLDTTGVLERSVETTQRWLRSQTGGRRLHYDVRGDGAPDITFARLSQSDTTMDRHGLLIRSAIEAELAGMGFAEESKIYAVYYDGTATGVCGGAAWPPEVPGRVAAVYLKGRFTDDTPPCDSTPLGEPTPGYRDFAMLHEIFHTLGAVSRAAPNHTLDGHVDTDPTDLMYSGPLAWTPTVLDANRQNYYNPNGLPDGVFNLATSPFLGP
jgi:hypothetical protein